MSKSLLFFCSFLLIFTTIKAQIQQEVNPPEHIKTVQFELDPSGYQFPVIELNESFTLTFDDLDADEKTYYYTIEHCNRDWTLSNLFPNDYMDGFNEIEFESFTNSYNTLQPYSHYKLTIPNQNTRLKLTGNYILKVYSDDDDELLFSRRFIIYRNIAAVGVSVKRARSLEVINQKQAVNFEITIPDNFVLPNPKHDIKVTLMQNFNWQHTITDLKPQFNINNRLIYKYDTEASFWGGNEYLFFDSKDIQAGSGSIYKVQLESIYNHYLYTNVDRAEVPYTFNPDINGNFIINTLSGSPDYEADYTWTHFSLKSDLINPLQERVYVYGKFNNYQIEESNELFYNPEFETYETSMLFKQGFL